MTTLKEIRDQVIDDLDLSEEIFVDEPELNRWINDGISVAESNIHTIYEDYFLSEVETAIISGQNLVDYPSDIYANKIRKIIYTDGNGHGESHEVRRVKSLLEATSRDLYDTNNKTAILEWSPINEAATGRKIRLFPTEGRAGNLIIWYLRNANKLVLDADICDIDEFSRFIVQYVKTQVFLKDGDPRTEDSKGLEEQFKKEMVDTLSNMIPDNNNEVVMDMSHYDESYGSDEGWF